MNVKKARNIGISLSYAYFVLNTIIGIFMSAFVIRSIGKTDYGVYQSISAFASYLVLLEFGTGTIMSRNISLCKKDENDNIDVNKNVSTIWYLTIILGVIICVIAGVLELLIDKIYAKSMTGDQIVLGKKLFALAVVNLLCSFFTHALNGIILGYEYYAYSKTVATVKLLLRTALLLIFLTIIPKIEVLVIIDMALSVSAFLSSLIFCITKIRIRFSLHYFDIEIFKLITPLALAMLLQTLVNTANSNVDKFLISIMMTPEDVSIYSISMSMFGLFGSIATLPVNMFMPQIANKMRDGIKGRALTEILIEPCRLNIIITGIICFGFLSVGYPFIVIVYGKEYAPAWLYAIIIIIFEFFKMFNAVVENVVDVMRKRFAHALILAITTILNIILTIVGISKFGMLGAASATGISLFLQTILLNLFYQLKIDLSIGLLIKKSFKGILSCLFAATALSIPLYFLFDNIFLQFFAGGVVFILVFIITFLKFGANDIEKDKIKKVLMLISNKKN